MPGKPYQSCLIPYHVEIVPLRSQKPPVSYARIAELLREKYGLSIQRAAIGKFVKVRAKGRKVYFFKRKDRRDKLPAGYVFSKAGASLTSDKGGLCKLRTSVLADLSKSVLFYAGFEA